MPKPTEKISKAFSKDRAAFMPYFTLGYPDYQTSLEIVEACYAGGAELIELGIPFSDPLADGPTIQYSTQVALENGITVAKCLEAVRELRGRGVDIPLIMMGYFNPILAYGIDRFTSEAFEAGSEGFIIPDLPPEEAQQFETYCQNYNLALIYLLAPNSPSERIRLVCGKSTGFTYLVSVTGITGARNQLPADLEQFVQNVRPFAQTPIAVGFGISTPEQAKEVGKLADGVIVGSALINKVREALQSNKKPTIIAQQFAKEMANALR